MKISLTVEPKLPANDRKALSAFVQSLKSNRSLSIGMSFMYRGSRVTVK